MIVVSQDEPERYCLSDLVLFVSLCMEPFFRCAHFACFL